AYIDVNRTDPSGQITWEIVAEAVGENYPSVDMMYQSGDYSQQDEMLERLKGGQPARVVTTDLPNPLRERYEKEGIKAELIAPIIIGDRWIGTMGYTDHVRTGNWDDIEVKALMRAAEMVGAYWEREAAREGLMELAQAKDRFIAAVSHELRTPLAAVVGFAGALAQGNQEFSPDEVAEMTSTIYHQSLELTHLVDDLLTSERAASGNLTVQPGALFLLRECAGIVASTIADVPVGLSGEEVVGYGDALRTRQVIRNLLTNAIRYGGGTISVEVSAGDSTARVTVGDNGDGVSHLDVDRIFDPYYRSQVGRSTPDSVGLGLAVARQLARLMDGDVVYRRQDGWTFFEFSLPLATETGLTTKSGDSGSREPGSAHRGARANGSAQLRRFKKETATTAKSSATSGE
ncbi:MAG: GAF domain-containing sensor histidine kinase, partial [Acidimicrobiia bacterium]|nr:GAF domain-containing sensor histidine kinase [Acidimicrobiia bacterium]